MTTNNHFIVTHFVVWAFFFFNVKETVIANLSRIVYNLFVFHENMFCVFVVCYAYIVLIWTYALVATWLIFIPSHVISC